MSLLPHTSTTIHDDEECLARLMEDANDIASFPSSLFVDRFLKDHDTSRWYDWVEQAEACGFVIPTNISSLPAYDASSTPATPAGMSDEPLVHAIALLLHIPRETAVELTTLAISSVDMKEAGLEWVLPIVECYHRQRMARLGLLTELLRLAMSNADDAQSRNAKQIVQQLDSYNLFAILWTAAVPCDSVPALSRPQREALQALPTQTLSLASVVANWVQMQTSFAKQEQVKAMEALIALCYEHVTIQRAHLVLVSIACPQTTQDLVGLWGLEGLALWKEIPEHPLLQGAEAQGELQELAKLWQRQCPVSKPLALMTLGLGLLLQAAQLPDASVLLETANDHDAFGYLYEVLTQYIRPSRSDDDDDDNNNNHSELDASSLMYAGIGREVVSAAISAFSHNLGNAENVDIFCLLAATVTQNSPTMTQQFWVDWAVYTKTAEERPLCVLLERAHHLAQQQNQFVPFLRLAASIVSTPESVGVVLDFLPPNLFSQALQVKQKNEDQVVVVLESIRALVRYAATAPTRQALCQAIDPKLLWQTVLECSNERAGAAGFEALSLLLEDNVEWTGVIANSFYWIMDKAWHDLVFRGNQTAEAAANFLSCLFRNMTTIFFAPTTNEKFILDFLEQFRHALLAVASLLSSSAPMLSKPVLVGQTQLTYRTAKSIMDCLHTTLQYAGPMEALHSSIVVCHAAADFRWSIMSSISGKAIIYYATVPVSLSIARLLDESVRDAQTIQTEKDSDSFQNWLSAGKHESKADTHLQSIILESLENPELLSFDFSDLPFQQGDTPKMPSRAASSAIDLLQQWCNVVESRRQDDLSSMTNICPHVLLSAKGDLPQVNPTTSRAVSAVWNDAFISCAGLFARYIQIEKTDDVDAFIGRKAMKLLVTFSEHAALLMDESFFQSIVASKSLATKLVMQTEYALNSKGESKDKIFTDCFAILARCASFTPRGVGQILPDTSWKKMTVFVQDVCSDTVAQRQRGAPITAHQTDLDIARGCLHLILSWRKAGVGRGMQNNVDIHSGLLRHMLTFLSVVVPSENDDDATGMLSDLRRLALDFIANELSIIQSDQINEPQKKLFAEIENVLGRDLSALVSMSKHYLEIRCLGPLFQMYDRFFGSFGSAAGKPFEQTLGIFFKRLEWHGQKTIDTRFASSWLGMFHSDQLLSSRELASTYSRFLDASNLLVSWKSLLTMVAVQEEANVRQAEQSQVLSMDIKRETLAATLQILETMELIQPHSLLLDTFERVVGRLSFLSLHDSREDKDWIKLIRLIADCCKKIVNFRFPVKVRLAGVQQLLVSSVLVLNAVRPPYGDSSVAEVCISLADIVCQVIAMIEYSHVSSRQHDNYLGCLSICISVLAALTPLQGSLETTYGLLKEYNVIQNLALLISTTTAIDGNLKSDSLASQCDTMVLAISFLSEIAVIGDADLLSLLVESELALLLPKRTTFSIHSVDTFPMRGYLDKSKPVKENRTFDKALVLNAMTTLERGVDDPRHRVWRSSIQFVASALRSATTQSVERATKVKYFTLAVDFLSANAETIKACLLQCSSIYFNQDHPALTMNALEEAGLILSLVGELCSKGYLEMFQMKCGGLYQMFLDLSKSLLASLSCFIGSCATSRELFRCIDKVEDADAMALDSISHLSDLGSIFLTLAGGISNARHEAIRYSHFASRCSSPVTLDEFSSQSSFPPEYKSDDRVRTHSDPHSLYSLEHKCREAVTNTFSFQLEVQAARVLSHVVQILVRTHPTASSLVMLSGEEDRPLKIPTIRQGTKVAIQVDPQPTNSWSSRLSLVEVVRCDTVNRRWEVCSWQDDAPVYSVVSLKQIVGIEDVSLRYGVLSSAPALRSSAELEKSVGAASLGHLILVLRWCGRYEDVLGTGNLIAKRLAELCTILLMSEVSVHRESGTITSVEVLSLQLMDLYGEEAEFSTLLEDCSGPLLEDRTGQLQTVLDGDVWSRAREQLHGEIRQATFRLKNRVRGRSHAASSRYSPGKSPLLLSGN